MPETQKDEFVRGKANWVRVGRGTPIWKPIVPFVGLLRGFFPSLAPATAPAQTGECWCRWKRQPGYYEIWRASMWWKRLVDCGDCEKKYEFYLDEHEYERPGEMMHAPGEFNVTETKGVWNESAGCVGCPEP
jgi:hypothetical protein